MAPEGDQRFDPNNLVLMQPCHGREEVVSFAVHRRNATAIVIAKMPIQGHHTGHKVRVLAKEPGSEVNSQNSLGWFTEEQIPSLFQNHIVLVYPRAGTATCADCFALMDNSESSQDTP